MRNRAKCKLCNEIVESLVHNDIVECKCGEITIAGGNQSLMAWAKSWDNFLRVDNDDNEIPVKYIEKTPQMSVEALELLRPSKEKLLQELEIMRDNISKLPANALQTPVNHYDLLSLVAILSAILRCES